MTTILTKEALDASGSSVARADSDSCVLHVYGGDVEEESLALTIAGDYNLERLSEDDDDEAATWSAAALESLRAWASENPE
jgi:hypothetical protein